MKHNYFSILVSIILILYGLAGAVGSFGSIYFVNRYDFGVNRIAEFTSPVEAEFTSMAKSMRDAGVASHNVANGLRNAKSGLNNARNTIYSASASVELAGQSISSVSRYVGFEVVGWQPFRETYSLFTNTGDSLDKVNIHLHSTANSISTTARDLGITATDADRMAVNFNDMAIKLDAVSNKFSSSTSTIPIWRIRQIVRYGLIYLGILHLMFLLCGIGVLMKNKVRN